MATLERNFYEGTPRQWELFDFDEVPYGTMHEGIPQKWELFGTEQPDFFEDQNIDTSKQVQDILENNEQTTFQPIDSVQQDTRQKVNSICSGVQEFPMEAFPMTIEGIHITYLHRAENIGEKEATINFRHDNKELYFLVTFERKNYRDRQDGSPYTLAENIKLKRPANCKGRYLVRNAKSGRGEYFKFELAEQIANEILNYRRFISCFQNLQKTEI